MVLPVRVGGPGPAELRRVSRALKDAGNKDLRNELRKNVRAAAKPLVDDIKRSADLLLPHSGGLNRVVSRKSGISAKTNINNAGIQIKVSGSKKRQLSQMNRGSFRHPVFGRPNKTRKQWTWVEQRVRPGFWDTPVKRSGPRTRKAVMQAVTEITKKVT